MKTSKNPTRLKKRLKIYFRKEAISYTEKQTESV